MATKVNYRLLTIIGLLVLIAAVIGGGMLYLRMRGNVERNLRTANEYYEAQEWKKAAGYYGRVLSKQPGNNEAIDKLLVVRQKQVPDTPEQARSMYMQYITLLKQAAFHASLDQQKQKASEVLEEHYQAAVLTNEIMFWRMLEDLTNILIQQSAEEDELVARAYLLRGLSKLRLNDEQLTDNIDGLGNIRFPGEDDIEKHLELDPDSDMGLSKLAFGRMAVARRLGLESRFAQEEKNLKLAQETFTKAVETNPQGVWTSLEMLRDAYVDQLWYLGKNLRDPGSVPREKLEELRDAVIEALANAEAIVTKDAIDNMQVVMDLVRYLRLIDAFEGDARAATLLEASLERDPDNDWLLYSLARSLYMKGDFEDSLASAEALLESPKKTVSLDARSQWNYKILAAKLVFDNLNQLYNQAEVQERSAVYEDMIAAKGVLSDLLAEEDHPFNLESNGKVAVVNRRWSEAANYFERVISQRTPDAMIMRLSAVALEENGQKGLAEERLLAAIEEYPNDLRNYLSLAEMYGRNGQPEKGMELLSRLPIRVIERNPMLTRAFESLKVLTAPEGQLPVNVNDPVLIALSRADAALKEDDTAAAMAALQEVIPAEGDVRILIAKAHVASLAGNQDQAVEMIEEAIEIQPTNSRLKLLRVRYGDPVEGIKLYCADRYPDPLERDAMIYENLRSLARLRAQLAEDARAEGDLEAEADNLAVVEAATLAMEDYRKFADQAVDSVAGAYVGRFEELLNEGKFEDARSMLPMAREKNFDGAEGNLAEARLEMYIAKALQDQGEPYLEQLNRGIIAAQRATEMAPWSDLAWRTLGWGNELNNNLVQAERAYGESFRRNPENAATFQKYVMLMLRPEGDSGRALAVLRESAGTFEGDDLIQDLWLEVEARYGDPSVTYTQRKKVWDENPENRNNALRLAAFLASAEPSQELILTDDGKRAINSRQWLGLAASRQTELLAKLQSRWDSMMDEILVQIEDQEDADFAQAILHARVYVDREQVDRAVDTLRRFLRTQADEANLSYQTIAAAQFLIDSERTIEAVQLLKEAVDSQTAAMEVDEALGSIYYGRANYNDAIKHFKLALEAPEPKLGTRYRMIESLLRTQQFEEGRKALDLLRQAGGSPYEVAMLDAFLYDRESVLAGAEGNADLQLASIAKYREQLQAAMSINPDNSRPYELLVESLLSEYLRTGQTTLLDQANRVISTASPVVRRSEPLMLSQADILEAEGKSRQAVLSMEEFVRANPVARDVRERLIVLHDEMGNSDKAIDAIRAAIFLYPQDPEWHTLLGEFQEKNGDIESATSAYIDAFNLQPTRRLLSRLNDTTRSAEKWDHEAVLAMAQKHQRLLETSPLLQSIHAKALARIRANSQARNRIRESRENYLRAIAEESLPSSIFPVWYEDLQVVFAEDDPMAGEAFALDLIEGEPTLDDYSGLAMYWSRWNSSDAWDRAIERQKEGVQLAEAIESDRLVEMLSRQGAIELSASRNADAAETFKRIVNLTPDDTMALNNYAYLLSTLAGKPSEALPYAQTAIRLAPENPAIIDTMATIQSQLGNHDAALTGRLKQLEYQPKDPELMGKIAMLYLDHTDTPQQAMKFAEQASKLRPRDAVLLDVEGWAAFKNGREAKGEDLILQSIRRQPTARAHLHLAEIYLAQNRVEKAREQLRLAVEIADDEGIKAQAEQLQSRIDGGK